MMKCRIYHVDAFTDRLFAGNPAGVCVLDELLPTDTLQQIAAENFLPETAFFVPTDSGDTFQLKWFTPEIEMDLCGHATLASAHVLFNHLNVKHDRIRFLTLSGELIVERKNGLIHLDFPSRKPLECALPEVIAQAFEKSPLEVFKSRDYVMVYENEEDVKSMRPNRALLDTINTNPGGIIITARGNEFDFVSRYFTPQASIFEDPVTGSAHCSLIPFWADRLKKTTMTAIQLSERQGKLFCEDLGARVSIAGNAVTYSEGIIYL